MELGTLVDLAQLDNDGTHKRSLLPQDRPSGPDPHLLALMGWYNYNTVYEAVQLIVKWYHSHCYGMRFQEILQRASRKRAAIRRVVAFFGSHVRWRNRRLQMLLTYWMSKPANIRSFRAETLEEDSDYIWNIFTTHVSSHAKRACVRRLYIEHKTHFIREWRQWAASPGVERYIADGQKLTPDVLLPRSSSRRKEVKAKVDTGTMKPKLKLVKVNPDNTTVYPAPTFALRKETFFVIKVAEKPRWARVIDLGRLDKSRGTIDVLPRVVVFQDATAAVVDGALQYSKLVRQHLQEDSDKPRVLRFANSPEPEDTVPTAAEPGGASSRESSPEPSISVSPTFSRGWGLDCLLDMVAPAEAAPEVQIAVTEEALGHVKFDHISELMDDLLEDRFAHSVASDPLHSPSATQDISSEALTESPAFGASVAPSGGAGARAAKSEPPGFITKRSLRHHRATFRLEGGVPPRGSPRRPSASSDVPVQHPGGTVAGGSPARSSPNISPSSSPVAPPHPCSSFPSSRRSSVFNVMPLDPHCLPDAGVPEALPPAAAATAGPLLRSRSPPGTSPSASSTSSPGLRRGERTSLIRALMVQHSAGDGAPQPEPSKGVIESLLADAGGETTTACKPLLTGSAAAAALGPGSVRTSLAGVATLDTISRQTRGRHPGLRKCTWAPTDGPIAVADRSLPATPVQKRDRTQSAPWTTPHKRSSLARHTAGSAARAVELLPNERPPRRGSRIALFGTQTPPPTVLHRPKLSHRLCSLRQTAPGALPRNVQSA